MAHGVDQLSWVTPAQIQGPLGRPNIPGHSGPGPSPRGVDQLSRETRARVRGHARCTSCPGHLWTLPEASQFCPYVLGDSSPVPRAHGLDQLFGRIALRSDGPRGRPPLWGDSDKCPRASVVHQMSRATWALVGHTAVSTKRPRRLRPVPEGTQGGPTVPGNSGPCPMAYGFEEISRAIRARVRGPVRSTSCPGPPGPVPEA